MGLSRHLVAGLGALGILLYVVTVFNDYNIYQNVVIESLTNSDNIDQIAVIENGTKHSNITDTNVKLDAMEWIELEPVSYGDGTCGDNPRRKSFTRVLQRWKEIAERHGVPYFLTCGSLIGAVRDGKVVPWDMDIDIMFDDRFNDVIAALATERSFTPDKTDPTFHLIIQRDFKKPYNNRYDRRRFDCRGKRVDENIDECSFQEPFGRLIGGLHHVELFDYHLMDTGQVYDPTEDGRLHDRDVLFPLRRCRFMGIEVMCPQKPKQFLQSLWYGKDVLVPDSLCKNGLWMWKRKHTK